MLITYQDYLSKERSEKELIAFVKKVIENHTSSDLYKTAEAAEAYLRHENPTITQYKKMLTTISGQLIPDEISPNYKMATGKFKTFVTQEVQYLLGNGASFGKEETKDKIGTKRKDFDRMLQKAAKYAIAHAVSFGLWNRDHVDVFNVLEFAPIYDEENGSLCAGVQTAVDGSISSSASTRGWRRTGRTGRRASILQGEHQRPSAQASTARNSAISAKSAASSRWT